MTYSTAMSPALADGVLEAFKLLQHAHAAREKLTQNIQLFKQNIQHSPLAWQDSNTPIQQLKLGCPKKALAYTLHLKKQNIHCIAMREPTVKRLDTGLRIVLTCHHTAENIQQLFECLHQCQI